MEGKAKKRKDKGRGKGKRRINREDGMRERKGRYNEKELRIRIRYEVNQIIKTERLAWKGLDRGSVKWKGKI